KANQAVLRGIVVIVAKVKSEPFPRVNGRRQSEVPVVSKIAIERIRVRCLPNICRSTQDGPRTRRIVRLQAVAAFLTRAQARNEVVVKGMRVVTVGMFQVEIDPERRSRPKPQSE